MKNNISLKLSKEIHALAKEKGVELTKCKYYYNNKNKITKQFKKYKWAHSITEAGTETEYKKEIGNNLPAYTTNELFEMLPNRLEDEGMDYSLTLRKIKDTEQEWENKKTILPDNIERCNGYEASIGEPSRLGHKQFIFLADTSAEALGLLYKELISQGIII